MQKKWKGILAPCIIAMASPQSALSLLSALRFEDKINARQFHTFFCLYLAHVPAHGHLASRVSFLFDKARVDPAGGVTLFFRVLAVFNQTSSSPCASRERGMTLPLPALGKLAKDLLIVTREWRSPSVSAGCFYRMPVPSDVLVLIHRYHPFPRSSRSFL